ncbi:hypothetical protein ACFUTR_36000 [Streptomyces sp. NPDC057367]
MSWLPHCLTRQAEQLLLDGHILRPEPHPLDRLQLTSPPAPRCRPSR